MYIVTVHVNVYKITIIFFINNFFKSFLNILRSLFVVMDTLNVTINYINHKRY